MGVGSDLAPLDCERGLEQHQFFPDNFALLHLPEGVNAQTLADDSLLYLKEWE
jgi:hypothetical protein